MGQGDHLGESGGGALILECVGARIGRPWQKCFEGEAKEVSLRSEQEGDMTGCNSRRGAQRCVEEAESIAMKCDGYCWPY
mmetsp:Transcript_76727/g.215748  ORF Transcript_76727/g.215748 Transcript_76727/m.215748 type:complete len:80 (+) Transcript_76727:1760-1999(+)